jgi:hypothetical protein
MLVGGIFIGLRPGRALRALCALRVISLPPAQVWPVIESYTHHWARKPDGVSQEVRKFVT